MGLTNAARVALREPRWRGDCAWRRVRFLDIHSTSVFRNVKVILAVNQVLADSDPVLNVLMATAVKTARSETQTCYLEVFFSG